MFYQYSVLVRNTLGQSIKYGILAFIQKLP